ncbi:MAG TPA: SMP-30/gluconolactonase/LRE family protein [Candidatus Binataceae bacterium]|jgi:sugar lactone lactonase YvrE|nr:SMP-30/gluconolactonase/LRE family protein [Candidatus Binataceae bacterium]
MRQFKTLLDGLCFGEGPRWHDGKLYFSDMHAHTVNAVDLQGRTSVVAEVAAWPSGLGWLPDGRMLVVSMTDRRLLRLENGALKLHADLSGLASFHCNDMVVDGRGRAYVGNFGYDLIGGAPQRPAELVMVAPDGAARVAARDLEFPNGTVITPDGKTLIVGESMGHRLTAFDIATDGGLANRRIWAELGDGVPDGIALDAEGAIWVASPMTHELLRVRQGGQIAERVKREQMPIACMLGGPTRRTLFLLTSESINPDECRAKRSARIETAEVEVAGAGWP